MTDDGKELISPQKIKDIKTIYHITGDPVFGKYLKSVARNEDKSILDVIKNAGKPCQA